MAKRAAALGEIGVEGVVIDSGGDHIEGSKVVQKVVIVDLSRKLGK